MFARSVVGSGVKLIKSCVIDCFFGWNFLKKNDSETNQECANANGSKRIK